MNMQYGIQGNDSKAFYRLTAVHRGEQAGDETHQQSLGGRDSLGKIFNEADAERYESEAQTVSQKLKFWVSVAS
jgi:hypothetical protein